MVVSDTDGFLTSLVAAYDAHKTKGSVSITIKRSDMRNPRSKAEHKAEDYKCLFRVAESNKKRKHSTTVTPKDHHKFIDSFSTILKAHMGSLKKRARTDKGRQKAVQTQEK